MYNLRRAFVHEEIYDEFMDKLHAYYATLKIGDPSDTSSQLGPLISKTVLMICKIR